MKDALGMSTKYKVQYHLFRGHLVTSLCKPRTGTIIVSNYRFKLITGICNYKLNSSFLNVMLQNIMIKQLKRLDLYTSCMTKPRFYLDRN